MIVALPGLFSYLSLKYSSYFLSDFGHPFARFPGNLHKYFSITEQLTKRN